MDGGGAVIHKVREVKLRSLVGTLQHGLLAEQNGEPLESFEQKWGPIHLGFPFPFHALHFVIYLGKWGTCHGMPVELRRQPLGIGFLLLCRVLGIGGQHLYPQNHLTGLQF